MNLAEKDYVVLVQCDIVKERCPGYLCEKAWTERTGGFAEYPKDKPYRMLTLTCGGCCGRALHRKLTLLIRSLKKHEKIMKDRIVVQLSSCITKSNFHAPTCPHVDYIKTLVGNTGLDFREDSVIDAKSEERRKDGEYHSER
ncbi:TPA: CGGC domain-containing protein [Candidatus Sumerlaeota bacterium]|jgi:predicted metal-binding protein|nr:CGGC domain-containing protein [Candidatus Sumerlaeota bacterium]